MIAVVASKEEHLAVAEFFQLFKTAWCFHGENQRCEVLISSDVEAPHTSAPLVVVYSSTTHERGSSRDSTVLRHGEDRVPIHGKCWTFDDGGSTALTEEGTGRSVMLERSPAKQTIVRIGFDLFKEVSHLLAQGQPEAFARIPTLDLHVAFLRELLVRHSVAFAEIPPVPLGYNFTACLTHDVDHPRLRVHVFDHTAFGFLYRATIGSIADWGRGRKTLKQVAKNLRATLSLPFVYLGIAPDPWDQFDRYLEIEGSAKSTFFVIPKKGEPGLDAKGLRQPKRAAGYDIKSIAASIRRVLLADREIGVHGIDAWRDSAKGGDERECVRAVTGAREFGIRMHWLFFDESSPAILESAGYSYDSTFGYNGAVGYRAGTLQVFKPLKAERLLELPLHLMDTAMFYPAHMNLSPTAAREEVNVLIENAARFGGVVTVNWHDRSIAPERLWDQPYIELVAELKRRGAWLPTAGDAVAWFRARREAVIQPNESSGRSVQITLGSPNEQLPGFRLRMHSGTSGHVPRSGELSFIEFPVTRSAEFQTNPAEQHCNAA